MLGLHPVRRRWVKVAVFPLVSKKWHAKKALEIFEQLRPPRPCRVDKCGSIGQRHRQDETGIRGASRSAARPSRTTTLPDRDSLKQKRVPVAGLAAAWAAVSEPKAEDPALTCGVASELKLHLDDLFLLAVPTKRRFELLDGGGGIIEAGQERPAANARCRRSRP